jgi:hypothetical protein
MRTEATLREAVEEALRQIASRANAALAKLSHGEEAVIAQQPHVSRNSRKNGGAE